MNPSKLGGRTTLFYKDKDMENVVAWLTDQPEVKRLIPRGWRPGGAKGKVGLCIDTVREKNIMGRLFHGGGRQEVVIMTSTDDGAAAVAARVAQKYGWPLPDDAKHGNDARAFSSPLTASVPKPKLVETVPAPKAVMVAQAEQAKDATAGKIETSLKKITPDVALEWLNNNTSNRPVSQQVVERYASDMRQGRWGVSESVIAFDTRGQLLNGQHRLWAVVEADTPITAHVATGYPPDAIAYFDDGYRRDNAQVYNLTHGTDLSKTHMSIARRLAGAGWRLAKGVKARELSRQDSFAVLDRYKDGIDFAVKELFSKTRSTAGLRTSGVLSVIARAFYSAPRGRLMEFCEVLRTGMAQSEKDSAAILLRNWLMMTKTNTSAGQNDAYAKTERALWTFLRGDAVSRNLMAATSELFLLPGEDDGIELQGEAARKMRHANESRVRATKARAKAAGKAVAAGN